MSNHTALSRAEVDAPSQDAALDLDSLVESLGAPPLAPCAMPKQQLEASRPSWLSALRLFGARAPRARL
ncbi:hypothetical protein [Cereibacter changlensis]|uniref:hypothetical protein n=1 Tax=Cereibacter changlensis TaxID=402884 RepID=UPI0040346193